MIDSTLEDSHWVLLIPGLWYRRDGPTNPKTWDQSISAVVHGSTSVKRLIIICWTKVTLTLAIGTGSNLVLLIKAPSFKQQAMLDNGSGMI